MCEELEIRDKEHEDDGGTFKPRKETQVLGVSAAIEWLSGLTLAEQLVEP